MKVKRTLLFAVILCLLLVQIPVTAHATTGTCGENVNWALDEGGLLTIWGQGAMEEYPWREAYANAITAVVIEEGVTAIRGGAFSECTNLKTAVIADTVTSIGPNAFNFCLSLESVNIPQGVQVLNQGVFMDCPNLTEIVIPSSVTEIGMRAFCYSGLKSVEIPKGVRKIGESVFYGCDSLKEIIFLGNAPMIGAAAFTAVTATAYYPAGNKTWTQEAMSTGSGKLTWKSFNAPDEGPFPLIGASVSLGESLAMHFFLDSSYVSEGCYAVITRSYGDGREDHVVTVPYELWADLEEDYHYVTYRDLAAKEMCDELRVVFYDAEGLEISIPWEDSIQAYAMRMLENETDPELLTLLVDMLNYGAAAQKQFGYNTGSLANAMLTETQQDYATAYYETADMLEAGPGRVATTLSLKNEILLQFIFSNEVVGYGYDQKALIIYKDIYGNLHSSWTHLEDFDAHHKQVKVPLAIADYSQVVSCSIHTWDYKVLSETTYDSIESYAHRMAEKLPEMVDALIKFGRSSYNYFL